MHFSTQVTEKTQNTNIKQDFVCFVCVSTTQKHKIQNRHSNLCVGLVDGFDTKLCFYVESEYSLSRVRSQHLLYVVWGDCTVTITQLSTFA